MSRRQSVVFRAILLAATLLLPDAAAVRADIAIAMDPTTGKAAAYNGAWDAEAVKREALSRCGYDCRIVVIGKGTCAAVVESISTGGSVWAVAYGTSTETAAQSAWHECRYKGGVNCKTAAAICE